MQTLLVEYFDVSKPYVLFSFYFIQQHSAVVFSLIFYVLTCMYVDIHMHYVKS